MTAITEGGLLSGRVRLRQPARGFRVAIDSVFLAAFASPGADERVLDAGCGVGAASLCLAERLPACRVDGLELQPDLAALAVENAGLNGRAARLRFVTGDLAAPPEPVAGGGYDWVITNPPYNDGGTPPADAGRAVANMEGRLDLDGWLRACLRLLKPRGHIAVVHRTDRLDHLLAALDRRVGRIELLPLHPKAGRASKRVLLRGRKGARAPLSVLPGLVLHEADGAYTAAAQAVLREARALGD